MDEQQQNGYETPPQAAPHPEEAVEAQQRMTRGMPTLFAAVFVGFVVVALIVLLLAR